VREIVGSHLGNCRLVFLKKKTEKQSLRLMRAAIDGGFFNKLSGSR
jgi:hypothetical protein